VLLTHTHARTKTQEQKKAVSQKRLESVCGKKEKSVRGRSYKYSNRHHLNVSSTARATLTRNYKTSRSETRWVDAGKQKLDVRGNLHLYSNTHRLNAFSAVRDTYTRNKENHMSEKAGVRMREETSTYFRVVRRRRAQDCTRG